jgi:hypothetical protein
MEKDLKEIISLLRSINDRLAAFDLEMSRRMKVIADEVIVERNLRGLNPTTKMFKP